MKEKYRVKNKILFNDIIKDGNQIKSKYFYIYYKSNNLDYPRFGIAVGKKVGNAVTRNKYKRIIRNILHENNKTFKKGQDYIIMIKKSGLDKTYAELKNDLQNY